MSRGIYGWKMVRGSREDDMASMLSNMYHEKRNPVYNKTRMWVNQIICEVFMIVNDCYVCDFLPREALSCRYSTHTQRKNPPISTFTSLRRHTGTSGIHKWAKPLQSAADTFFKVFLSFPVQTVLYVCVDASSSFLSWRPSVEQLNNRREIWGIE